MDYEKPPSTGAQAKISIGSFFPFSTASVKSSNSPGAVHTARGQFRPATGHAVVRQLEAASSNGSAVDDAELGQDGKTCRDLRTTETCRQRKSVICAPGNAVVIGVVRKRRKNHHAAVWSEPVGFAAVQPKSQRPRSSIQAEGSLTQSRIAITSFLHHGQHGVNCKCRQTKRTEHDHRSQCRTRHAAKGSQPIRNLRHRSLHSCGASTFLRRGRTYI